MSGVQNRAAAMNSLLRLSIFIKSSCFFWIRGLRAKPAAGPLSIFLNYRIVGATKVNVRKKFSRNGTVETSQSARICMRQTFPIRAPLRCAQAYGVRKDALLSFTQRLSLSSQARLGNALG